MKLYSISKPFSAALCAVILLAISVAQAQSTLLELRSTIQDAQRKNIAFFSVIGGTSHYNWVLSIGQELGQRGHTFYFLSADEDAKYGEPFTRVKTVPTGPGTDHKTIDTTALEDPNFTFFQLMKPVLDSTFKNFSKGKYFSNKIDLAICDHIAESCVEAAIASNLPFIVTATADYTKGVYSIHETQCRWVVNRCCVETSAPYVNNDVMSMKNPTTENESIATRFNNMFILPFQGLYHLLPTMRDLIAQKKLLGIDAKLEDPYKKWQHSLKLINNLYGFTAPRPMSPMVEMVGPIIPKKYKPLTPELQEFLDAHTRVAYIAFGQTSVPSTNNIRLLLTAVMNGIERGALDGFLWATVGATMDRFPSEIKTLSGKTYLMQDIFNQVYPNMRMEKWTPQTAVLLHPSTALFVSHGGLGSWYESMYAGKRMIMYPFYGDQPLNANAIESNGLGAIMRPYLSPEQAADLVCTVANSQDIGRNVRRYQALVHLHSDHGIFRGANLVEEVLYTNKDGRLPHRETADKRMSYVKAHNIDLWCLLGLIALLSTTAIGVVLIGMWKLIRKRGLVGQRKIKKN
ncbi:UDP-glucoronosyl and UDP-glucosyl transferase [Mucor ambiguus]|uniref:UDP-glucoronosyl and UDP-glucosyl transferase n=1 Tax=Mucor ambiguus TaxID=91626 RepID=A0A0C9MLU7_9FUNG|nr:UDP-glucoronosyl and UDP-glucosyl transferase [Mucor ambiguus]